MLGLAGCGRDGPWAAGMEAALGCRCEGDVGATGLLWGHPKLKPWGGGSFQESRGKLKVSSIPGSSLQWTYGTRSCHEDGLRSESRVPT